MANFRAGSGKVQNEPGKSSVRKQVDAQRMMGTYQQGTEVLEGTSTGQIMAN